MANSDVNHWRSAMSTSLLYHAQDMKGIHHSRTEFKEGRTVFHAVVSNGCCRCSKCGSRRVVQSGGVYREFKLVPTGTRKNLLRLYIPRLVCRECGAVRQVARISHQPPEDGGFPGVQARSVGFSQVEAEFCSGFQG